MTRLALALLVGGVVGCVGPAAAAQDIDDITEARILARAGRHTDAIAMLRRLLGPSPENAEIQLLLGTVLSREEQFDEARGLLERVLIRYPQDVDAIAALMNVELWSGRPRESFALARRGLDLAPNDDRFLLGRRRAQEAIDLLVRPWEVVAGVGADWFDDDRDPWHEAHVSLTRETPAGPITVRGLRASRFALTDHQFELEMHPRFRPGTSGYVAFGFAPDERLYPGSRVAADLYQALGSGFEATGGIRRLSFAAVTTLYTAGLNKYVGNWLVGGRGFFNADRSGEGSRSFHASARRYFGADDASYAGVRYIRGSSREEIRDILDLEVLASDTIAGELRARLGRRLVLQVDAGTGRQERVSGVRLRQHTVAASAGTRF